VRAEVSVQGLQLALSASVSSTHRNLSPNRLSMRRIVGIVTGLCALYLTVGGIDAPCNDHSRQSRSVSMPGHDGAGHELPVQKNGQPKPCKSSPVPCCASMTSCMSIAIAEGAPSSALPIANQYISSFDLTKPLSRIAAPEPPPPKV